MKMWIVKREVLARNLKEAIKNDGRIYAVEEADQKYQPIEEKKLTGFKS